MPLFAWCVKHEQIKTNKKKLEKMLKRQVEVCRFYFII